MAQRRCPIEDSKRLDSGHSFNDSDNTASASSDIWRLSLRCAHHHTKPLDKKVYLRTLVYQVRVPRKVYKCVCARVRKHLCMYARPEPT